MYEFAQALGLLIFYLTNDTKIITLGNIFMTLMNRVDISRKRKLANLNASFDIITSLHPSQASKLGFMILKNSTKDFNKSVGVLFRNMEKSLLFSQRKLQALETFLGNQFERQINIPSYIKNQMKSKKFNKNFVTFLEREARRKEFEAAQIASIMGLTGVGTDDYLAFRLYYRAEHELSKSQLVKVQRTGAGNEGKFSLMVTYNGVTEYIKFYGSSWLVDCIYHYDTKDADFRFKKGKHIYTFYKVPRVAIYIIQKINGRGMWNGFGFNYSLNPFNWVRGHSFRMYEKRMGYIKSRTPGDINYEKRREIEKWNYTNKQF